MSLIGKCFGAVGAVVGFYFIIILNIKYNHWIGTIFAFFIAACFAGLMDWFWQKANSNRIKDDNYEKQKQDNWDSALYVSWGLFVCIVLLGFLTHSRWTYRSIHLNTVQLESILKQGQNSQVNKCEDSDFAEGIDLGLHIVKPKKFFCELYTGFIPISKYIVYEVWSLGRDFAMDTNQYYLENPKLPKQRGDKVP